MSTVDILKQYVNGNWTKKRPTKPGLYHTQTHTGIQGPDVIAYHTEDGKLELSSEWKELFWSEPLPK